MEGGRVECPQQATKRNVNGLIPSPFWLKLAGGIRESLSFPTHPQTYNCSSGLEVAGTHSVSQGSGWRWRLVRLGAPSLAHSWFVGWQSRTEIAFLWLFGSVHSGQSVWLAVSLGDCLPVFAKKVHSGLVVGAVSFGDCLPV